MCDPSTSVKLTRKASWVEYSTVPQLHTNLTIYIHTHVERGWMRMRLQLSSNITWNLKYTSHSGLWVMTRFPFFNSIASGYETHWIHTKEPCCIHAVHHIGSKTNQRLNVTINRRGGLSKARFFFNKFTSKKILGGLWLFYVGCKALNANVAPIVSDCIDKF